MGKVLYRKYRSRKLSEIIGQEHITTTLTNALKSGQLSHAYLFTGPRGVGKTSVARILAHEINNLPYSDDSSHLDIIEIDAASNRRIDEIRQLRERINLAPAIAKYKVYIIDEVHMLTREAFNALLKTLEEPPEHVIFILATTEAYKVPDTIISRTQQFNFRPISSAQMAAQLKKIAKEEKIKIDDDSLLMIAEYGEGSFRDSLSLLDQVSSIGKDITTKEIDRVLGMAPEEQINSLIKALEEKSPKKLVEQLNNIYDSGYSTAVISKQLLLKIRTSLLSNNIKLSDKAKLDLTRQLIEVPISNDSDTLLEIVLLSAVVSDSDEATISEPVTETIVPAAISVETLPKKEEVAQAKAEPISNKPMKKGSIDVSMWPEVLNSIKSKHNTLYGIARMTVPNIENNQFSLVTKFEFHGKTLNEDKNRRVISDIIKELTGQDIIVKIVVDKKLELSPTSEDNSEDVSTLSTINNIFGDAEVLE